MSKVLTGLEANESLRRIKENQLSNGFVDGKNPEVKKQLQEFVKQAKILELLTRERVEDEPLPKSLKDLRNRNSRLGK